VTRHVAMSAVALALVGVTATALSQQPTPVDPGAALPGVPQQVTLRVGDSMVVDGVSIGCAVKRRAGRVGIECGRTGRDIAGSYMTIVARRTVKVARLRSAGVAKVILTATHGGGWHVCGTPRSTALAARAAGCR
jgi:hypothetical protein